MFDLIFSGMQAYEQIGMLVAAVICLAFGGLFLGNSLYWRLSAARVTGTIIGVVPERGMYAAVYRYAGPDGAIHEARSDSATGWLGGYRTGRVVTLLVSPHNPAKARPAHSLLFEIVGAACLVPGVLFAWTALTAFPIGPMTWLVAAVPVAYLAYHGYGTLRRDPAERSWSAWRKRMALADPKTVDMATVRTAEEIQTGPGFRLEWLGQVRQSKIARLAVGVFALVLLAVGVVQGARIARLETSGLRAPGEVVSLREEYSSSDDGGGSVYYPVVRFRTAAGNAVEFKDAVGGNPPPRRVGDHVTVLYLGDQPAGDAIVDSGLWWNAALPALAILGALVLAWLWFAMRLAVRPDQPLPLSGKIKSATSG